MTTLALACLVVIGAPPDEGREGDDGGSSVEVEPVDDDKPDPEVDGELKPDPYDDRADEDEGEAPPPLELPPEGEARRPAMPLMDRDLVSPRAHPVGRGAAQLSLTSIGEDEFIALNVGYLFKAGRWRFAPRLVLRLRIVDGDPETADVIRMEDWDEPSDFARLLGSIQFGHLGEPLVLRYGELNGVTIGHGSIVNRYFNTIDIDHYQGGLYLSGDAGVFGAEGVINDVFGPDVMVARVFVRPMDGAHDLPLPLSGLKIGLTAGADLAAPTAIASEGGRIFSTPEWEPEVLGDRLLTMFALDLEIPVVSSPHLDVVPYVDVATLGFDTFGVHVGSHVNARFTRKSSLRTRLEYRWAGAGHEPGYVSPFYEIERFSYHGGDPKLWAIEHDAPFREAWGGFHLEADLRIERLFGWSIIFTTSGREPRFDLLTRLKFPELGPVRLTLFLARLGFDDFEDLFDNERTTMGASVRVMVWDPVFVRGRIVREWWLARDADGASRYGTTTDWDLGAGLLLRF